MQLLKQPGGSVYMAEAINWTGSTDTHLKICVTKQSIQNRANRGLTFLLGQLYGLVCPGLIMTQHVFQGLRRDMLVRSDEEADRKKLAITWASTRDAVLVGDKAEARLEYRPAPPGRVFAVYVSPNEMLEEYPAVYGWAEHWAWIASDPGKAGAPVDHATRYDRLIWSKE